MDEIKVGTPLRLVKPVRGMPVGTDGEVAETGDGCLLIRWLGEDAPMGLIQFEWPAEAEWLEF